MLDQITPLILTYNEEPNLERTMSQLTWASDIVVVDSFSDDATTTIIRRFPQARIFQREFDSFRCQWTFALTKTGIGTPWVLALDADFVLTDELISELRILKPEVGVNGYTARFSYCIHGKPLRSGILPPLNVLYRASEAVYEHYERTHRVTIRGDVRSLRSKILHDDRKPLRRWLLTQVKYAPLEAHRLQTSEVGTLRLPDRIRRWLIIAPAAVLLYCLILKGGLFDGWAGFFYAFQRTLAEVMVSLHLLDDMVNRRGER